MLTQRVDPNIYRGRTFRCIYCGNTIFADECAEDNTNEWPAFLSPEYVINVRAEEDKRFPRDMLELFCHRCGMSLGYKLVDRSGLIGSWNYIRTSMLEVSYN